MKDTGIRLTLTHADEWTGGDGVKRRREDWLIEGGEIAEEWARSLKPGRSPWCRFTLYLRDGEVDPNLASYGGEVWPSAWPEVFEVVNQGTRGQFTRLTRTGELFRAAALDGASAATPCAPEETHR